MNKVLEFFIRAKDYASAVIDKVVGKINQWKTEAEKSSKAVAQTQSQSKQAFDAVSDSMKRTSVNWQNIKDAEERAKQRTKELILLKLELAKTEKAAARASGEAAEQMKQRAEMLKKGISQLQQNANQDLNLMGLGMNALNGNIVGVGRSVIQLAARFKMLGMSMAAMSIYTLAIMAIVKIFTLWRDKVDECNKKIRELKMEGLKKQFELLGRAMDSVNKRMEQSVKLTDDMAKHQNALLASSAALAKAQNEQARQGELTGVSDEQGRSAINRRYDEANARIDAQARKERFARELDAEQKKLEEYEKALSDNEILLANARAAARKARAEQAEAWTDSQFDKDDEDYKAAVARYKEATASLKKFTEAREALMEKRNASSLNIQQMASSNRASLAEERAENARRAREAQEEEARFAKERVEKERAIANEVEDAWFGWHTAYIAWEKDKDSEAAKLRLQLAEEYYEAIKEAADDEERERIRNEREDQSRRIAFIKQMEDEQKSIDKEASERQRRMEEERAAKEKADKAAQLSIDKANAESLLNDLKDSHSAAQSRVSAAQAAVAQAWGWYRDKGSLARQREEWGADAEARRQYAKDLYSLQHGRNAEKLSEALYLSRRGDIGRFEERMQGWRDRGLSVEDEATMRMAVAEDAEKRANEDLARINEQTARAADAVESIHSILTNGGEP